MIGFKPTSKHFLAANALLLFTALSHIDTANAQNGLLISPSTVSVSSVLNATPAAQTVNITINNLPVTSLTAGLATYTAGQAANWVASAVPTVNPAQSYLTINFFNNGLLPGTYNATIPITAQGITANIPVVWTVYNSTTLTADQSTLNFTAQTNGSASAAQLVNIGSVGQNSSAVSGVSFTATSSQPWLTVVASSTVTPSQLTVSINPTGLAVGTLSGTITLNSPGLAPVTISVNLVVSGLPSIAANPNPVTLLYQYGVGAAPSQNVQLSSSSGTLNYVAAVTYPASNPCGPNWLQATSGLVGTTPAAISLTTSVTGLPSTATCTATITVNAPNASNPTLAVPVTLSISPNPQIGVTPTFLSFSYSVGTAIPVPQNLTVFTSNNTALNFSIAAPNAPWLSLPVTPPNGFPANTAVTVGLNPSVLATLNPGSYNGTITISSLGSGIAPVNVPVTLTISNNPLLLVTPPILYFNYQTIQSGGQLPSPLTFNLTSTLGSIPYMVSLPSTTGNQFVTFSPSTGTATTTPTPITVALNSAAVSTLTPGTYQVPIQISGTGASAGVPVATVQVNLNVSNSPLVNVSPQSIVFPAYTQNGAQPAPVQVSLTSTNATVPLGVTVSSNQSWLGVTGLSSPTTPSQFFATFAPAGLSPGTYTGSITVTAGAQVQQIPVTAIISSSVAISVAPATLTFTQPANGTAPAGQQVTVNTTNNQGVGFSANTVTSSGGNWLLVNGSTGTVTGTAPVGFTISVNATGLAQGTYTGNVVVTAINASNPTLNIPVTLTVTAAQTVTVNSTALTFTGAVSGAAPGTQTISITSATGSPVAFTASATSGSGSFLSVTPTSGTTPATITVSVNQAGLAAGTYTGTVTITPAGSGPLTVPVTFTVGAQAVPVITNVQNGASFGAGSVVPGELVSLFGTGLGPVTPVGTTLTSAGKVSTNIGGVQVFFNGIAAPLTYVIPGQINAVVPYELNGVGSAQVTVNFNGVTSAAFTVPVGATSPGIFTVNGAGSGPAASLNQNNTVNSTANPAARGSVITLFGTGEGVTNPTVATGAVINPSNLTKPVAPVTVTIGGQTAVVQYAGSAPGDVAGVLQLNVTIPANITPGAVPVTVQIGSVTSQSNVTIAVQ